MKATRGIAMIAGATGLIGSFLTRELRGDKRYSEVYVLVRREGFLKKMGLDGDPRLKEIVIDYDHPDLGGIVADVVFCALGTTMKKAGSREAFSKVDHEYVLELARICKRNQTESFLVVSSMGANPGSSNFYLKVKGMMERDLEQIGFKNLIIFRPSLLLGPRKEYRRSEKLGEKVIVFLKPLLRGRFKKWIPVHASQVAMAMLFEAELEGGFKIVESNAIREFEQ